jgi:hypothetical protein
MLLYVYVTAYVPLVTVIRRLKRVTKVVVVLASARAKSRAALAGTLSKLYVKDSLGARRAASTSK